MPSQGQKNMNALGDMLKAIERSSNSALLPNIPIYARLDGKSFSKFTRGMLKPYDPRLTEIMVNITKTLVAETNATLGYTQSDEISLYWKNALSQAEMPFGGRRDKFLGELVGIATAAFMLETTAHFPERTQKLPRFDCRVFNTSQLDSALFFLWREMDAIKNSINLAAGQHFSHKRLNGVSTKQRREWLREAGDPWEDYPDFFKRGVYVGRFLQEVSVTSANIPDHIKANMPETITRQTVKAFTRDPVQRLESPLEIFNLDRSRYTDISFIDEYPLHQASGLTNSPEAESTVN